MEVCHLFGLQERLPGQLFSVPGGGPLRADLAGAQEPSVTPALPAENAEVAAAFLDRGNFALADLERDFYQCALLRHNGNVAAAARTCSCSSEIITMLIKPLIN
jgi:hypothetical protein